MATDPDRPDVDLYDECVREASAAFSLALVSYGREPRDDDERHIADIALKAGVAGALNALRKG